MPGQSDDLSLRIGYWLAVHRDQLRTWWAISIIIVDVALLIFFIIMFTQYSFTTMKTVHGISEMSASLVSPPLRRAIAPAEPELGTPVALGRGQGRYDIVVPVTNPNPLWAAVEVRYRISYGPAIREDKTSIWPGAEQYLLVFNMPVTGVALDVKPKVEITNVRWQRPTNLALFSNEVSFPTSEVSIKPVVGLTTGGSATRLTATIKNESVFSFRSVRFGVVLKSGGAIVAGGEATLEQFDSFADRSLEVTWLQSLPLNADATVFPVVNLLDPAVYQ